MKRIIGAGGGGKDGGGGGGIQEDPDTLSSVAFASFVEVLGEGPIVGLVNGEYSIYIDGVPLRDLSGTPNYKPFTWDFRTGTQAQSVIPGFAGTQTTIDVGVKFQKSQGQIIRDIPDAYADAVRVTIAVAGLSETTEKGEIKGTSVEFKIGIRKTTGTWKWSPVTTITGKTGSRYQASYEFDLASLGTGPYQVSVIRVTDDSTSQLLSNDTYWDYYTAINYEQYTYPNTALAAIRLDARYFSSIPTRTYHVQGLYIQVPKNYDPVSRKYATTGPGTSNGTWDGTFKTAYSNNPAWVYYAVLTNTRWGLGKRLTASQVNKWELYEIGIYCDELVPTGLNLSDFSMVSGGGFGLDGKPIPRIPLNKDNAEPRFTINCVINSQDDAYKVLNTLSSVFRGMSYWGGNQVVATQDRPTDSTFLLNNTNVKGGAFRYSGTSRAQRRTCAVVMWSDPDEGFKPKYEYVQDREGIKKYGISTENLVAFGCTSRWQARRCGLWFLVTERYETDAVECSVGQDFAFVMPGDVGEIMDANKSGLRWGGRVLANCTTTQINLDAPVTLTAGSYTLYTKMPDNTVYTGTVTITTAGDRTSLITAPAMPSAPLAGAMWGLSSAALNSRKVRVVSKTMDGKDGYGLFMVTHNPTKYDAVDYGAAIQGFDYSKLEMDTVDPVKNLKLVEQSYKPFVGAPTRTDVLISYDSVASPLHKGFYVKMSKAGTVFEVPLTADCSTTFSDVPAGAYTVLVRAVNQFNKVGPDSIYSLTVTGIDSVKPASVANFRYEVDGSNGIRLLWDTLADYIDAYVVREGYSWDTATLVAESKSDRLPPIQMTLGEHSFLIKARDTSLNYSEVATPLTFTLQDIGTPVIAQSFKEGQVILTWNEVTSILPIVSYEFRHGGTTWENATVLGETRGAPLNVPITWVGDRVFRAKARDTAGNRGPMGVVTVSVAKPLAPTGLGVAFSDTDAILSWTKADGPLPIREFEIRFGNDYASSTFVDRCSGTSYRTPATWPAGATNARKFWITQVDSNNQVGTPAPYSVTIAAPTAPTVTSDFDGTSYVLQWTGGGGSLRIDEFVIRYGTSFATGTEVARVKAGSFSALVNWGGARTFFIAAKDCAGNIGAAGSSALTVAAPPAPSVTTLVTPNYAAQVSWTSTQATLPVVSYIITWVAQSGETVTVTTSANTITTDINWTGNKAFTVKSVDSAGNVGTGDTSTLVITVPSVVTFDPATIVGPDFSLSWRATKGSLPIASYELRYGAGAFDSCTAIATLDSLNYSYAGAWTGSRVVQCRAKDIAGNVGNAGSVTLSIVPPLIPTITQTVIDNNVILKWNDCTRTMPIKFYEVRHAVSGTPVASAEKLGTLLGLFTTAMEVTKGYYDYFVCATDSAGNVSDYGKVTAFVNQPPDYQVRLDRDSDFNGVNYEFSAAGNPEGWTVSGATQNVSNGVDVLTSTGTDPMLIRSMGDQFFYGCEHPVIYVKIRRVAGTGWQGDCYFTTAGHSYSDSYKETTADVSPAIGETKVVVFDMSALTAGTTDWMSNQITGIRFDFGTSAGDVFEIDYIRFVPWVGSNVMLLEDNTIILPINTTETFQQHFDTRTWATPQAQVSAGYPIVIEPSMTSAYYEEIIDYGATLPGTQIQVTYTLDTSAGSLTPTVTLSTKKLWTDAWADSANTSSIYAVDFRYVKIRIDVTATGGDDVAILDRLNTKLSLKMRTQESTVITGGPARVQGNKLDYSGWAVGSTVPTGWSMTGSSPENKLDIRTGPGLGYDEVCWISYNTDVAADQDGGFSSPLVSVDTNKSYVYGCFIKSLSQNGATRVGAYLNNVYTLAGAVSPLAFAIDADLPTTDTWYLCIGFLHAATYSGAALNIGGVYNLAGTKQISGTEYKQIAGVTQQRLRAYQAVNTLDTSIEIQQYARPFILECAAASFNDTLAYILATVNKNWGVIDMTPFAPIDVASIKVSANARVPVVPIYDFVDTPYPKSANVAALDISGNYLSGVEISWTVTGTW